ncbi:helix-turn-helix domain-containing protein [Nocardia sp. NPDC019395]|uniref:helix-turn-helix domain-containing protein n=1 Tax=Nocardia sp. NPDC019395 TaxID=3154686 RepID=UPI00340C8113
MDEQLEVTGFEPDDSGQEDLPGMWADHVTEMQGAFTFHFGDTDNFTASSGVQRWQNRVVAQFSSTDMKYDRTARQAASDGDAGQRLIVPIRGHLGLTAGRNETVDLAPGSVGVFRMDYPMSLEHRSGIVALMATVPDGALARRLVAEVPPILQRDQPMVAMLASHIEQMNSFADTMTARQFKRGTEIMFQLFAYALDEREFEFDTRSPLAKRIREVAWENSDDADFSLNSLAAACKCSVSQLYKSLEGDEETPAELLRRFRLEKAWDRLQDDTYRNMHEVATASGFNHVATFHQAFVNYYKTTPGKVREQLSKGSAAAVTRPRRRPVR